MTNKLFEAIAKGEALIKHLRDLDSHSGDADCIEQLIEAARVVEMLEALPKPWTIQGYSEGYVILQKKIGRCEANTLSEALRAALDKIGGG